MGNRNSGLRAVMAAITGVTVALAGSLGVAGAGGGSVGSRSGNEGVFGFSDARGAYSQWSSRSGSATKVYYIGAWFSDATSVDEPPSGVSRWAGGGVVAVEEDCLDWRYESTCSRRWWRGDLSDDHGFWVDTDLRRAGFVGDLFDTESGERCAFDVAFTADQRDDLEGEPAGYHDFDDEEQIGPETPIWRVFLPGTITRERWGGAEVSTNGCWGETGGMADTAKIWHSLRHARQV